MDESAEQAPLTGRPRRPLVGAAVLLGIALAFVALVGGADAEETDEPEVCTSTVYEGCPGRWEAEWATPTE